MVATSSQMKAQVGRASTQSEMDAALNALYASKDAWVQTSVKERLILIDEMTDTLTMVMNRWVEAGQHAKQLPPDHPGNADDWAFATIPFRQLNLLKMSLSEIQKYGRPQIPGELRRRDDGRVVAPVFPKGMKDNLVYAGLRGEVWFRPGIMPDQILAAQAAIYRDKGHRGKVALVLGAGNVSGLLPGDFMYKLFAEDQVVILKMNPVNEYLGPIIEEGYRPLVERDFLRVVYGGVEEGAYLIEHPYVEELHITGSDKTHDAIVFGVGEEAKRRRRERTPKTTKRFTSELGNVTPVIVVPGSWTENDITYQANNIAGQLVVNAGFNCLTPRVVVQQAAWQHRHALNQQINAVLQSIPTRYAYYPGAEKRFETFIQAYPNANQHGEHADGKLPWTYIEDINPHNEDNVAFNMEAFCSLMTETALDTETPADFLDRAVEFVNETLWGTLTAMLIVHPESLKDPATAAAVDRAVANLRYGSVCVNLPTALGYAVMATSWGGHAGSDIYDIQSGIGVVNNTLLFDGDHIQKSVLHAPFRSPLTSQQPGDTRFVRLIEKIAWLEAKPGAGSIADLVMTAFRP